MSDWKTNGQCARLTGIHGKVAEGGNPFPLLSFHGNVGAPVVLMHICQTLARVPTLARNVILIGQR